MKKIIKTPTLSLFLIVLCHFSFFYSQTYRFIYDIEFKAKEAKEYKKDLVVTDVNRKNIKSYSYEYLVYDSINKSQKSIYFANPVFEDRIIKNIETNTTVNFENFLENSYSYETHDEITWNVLKDSKKIGSFTAQKATANFGGRHWTAWFTEEMPFQHGPYKFGGLPGLILELKDDDNEFIFSFNRNINIPNEYDTSSFLESFYGDKPVKTSYSKIEKLKINYYNDPYREFKLGQKKGNFQDDQGNTIDKPDYNKMAKIVQKNIENNNNYIEKYRIINYTQINK